MVGRSGRLCFLQPMRNPRSKIGGNRHVKHCGLYRGIRLLHALEMHRSSASSANDAASWENSRSSNSLSAAARLHRVEHFVPVTCREIHLVSLNVERTSESVALTVR